MKPSRKALVNRFVVGPLGVNCYVVADPDTKDACVIDPGADGDKIKRFIDKNGLKLKFIINTHGHGDHIASNKELGAPVYIHAADKDCLTDPKKNMSAGIFMFDIVSPEAARLLKDGESISLGSLEMKVLHTPGHTRGSISLVLDNVIFTGDTLFHGGVGRSDLPGGDEDEILSSIREKLLTFEDDIIVYPGHGGPSTIGEERKNNPFLA
jgi:glyoxylase-like metal-dependent hydrolase (beta-lactamase superfamily II)